jgi:hypothetical protein
MSTSAGTDAVDRLAGALLARVAALFRIEHVGPADLDQPVFEPEGDGLGGRAFDSLDLALLGVTLEDELGTALIAHGELEDVATLRQLAAMAAPRCNPVALDRFCTRWAPPRAG